MNRSVMAVALALIASASSAETYDRYYAHDTQADEHGVIAPWYQRQNGQFDYRVRIAAETLKRYPWVDRTDAIVSAPEYLFNGQWSIDANGAIESVEEQDWNNGDLPQRVYYILGALIPYYRYSGDPDVIRTIEISADYLIDHCQTPANHGWPKLLISVPTFGERYGPCKFGSFEGLKYDYRDKDGNLTPPYDLQGESSFQLDLIGGIGLELVRTYQLTGKTRYLDTARHWANLLAENRSTAPGEAPWGRYANKSGGNGMNSKQTGGVGVILSLFDELIRLGYTGTGDSYITARDAGDDYLRNRLLPRWTVNDTWGRNYWDWIVAVQDLRSTEVSVVYMLDNKERFPNWKNDVRNILALFLNRTSSNPESGSDVFHGAWAYPESTDCCARSLAYSPYQVGTVFLRFGVEAESEWALEIGRRSLVLSSYDVLPNGESHDLIDGGTWIHASWFKIAHPASLKSVLRSMSWAPAIMGANRENHIMRSSSVVQHVIYGDGLVQYRTFDAPIGGVDVLRLAFQPTQVRAGGKRLKLRTTLDENGYSEKMLEGGDYIVTIRHDGATEVEVAGEDPQLYVDTQDLDFSGDWSTKLDGRAYGKNLKTTSAAGASVGYKFTGNQLRLIGSVGPEGGLADVFIDGVHQLVSIDFHNPLEMSKQVVYYINGLSDGLHEIEIVAQGKRNPVSTGQNIYIDGLQYSAAIGDSGFGSGGGPTDTQRFLFGYTEREDFVDSNGHKWRPGAEFIARSQRLSDSVDDTWWTTRRSTFIDSTTDADEELYRYGIHWNDFKVNVTVGPGTYYALMKFSETEFHGPNKRLMSIYINGELVKEGFDVFATADEEKTAESNEQFMPRALDLRFEDIKPANGVIEIRFVGEEIDGHLTEAMIQALEVGPQ